MIGNWIENKSQRPPILHLESNQSKSRHRTWKMKREKLEIDKFKWGRHFKCYRQKRKPGESNQQKSMRCNAQENISKNGEIKIKKQLTSAHAFVIYTRKKKKNPKNPREKKRKAFKAQFKSKVSRPFLFLLFAFGVFLFKVVLSFWIEEPMVRREDQSFDRKKKEEEKRITTPHEWQMLPWYHISKSVGSHKTGRRGTRIFFSGSAESHPHPHPKGPSLATSNEQGSVVGCGLTLYDMTQPVTMRGMFEK